MFCNRLGRGWTTTHCQDRFKAAVKVAGVRTPGRLSLHSLRHTFASLMIGNGLDVVFVSGQLGHANPTVTLRTHTHLFARAGHAQAARQALESSYEAMARSSTATSSLPS